ncbi:hypothetical protein KIPB_016247, partial [Kipferlia bialata]|eukprot:g16247.t1
MFKLIDVAAEQQVAAGPLDVTLECGLFWIGLSDTLMPVTMDMWGVVRGYN